MRVAFTSSAASPASFAAPRRAVHNLLNTLDMVVSPEELLHELTVRSRGIHRVAGERVDFELNVGQRGGSAQRTVDHVKLFAVRMRVDRDVGEIKQLLGAQDPIVESRRVTDTGNGEQGGLRD